MKLENFVRRGRNAQTAVDAEIRRQTKRLAERTCRVCGCSEHDACVDPDTGQTCGWADVPGSPLCTACRTAVLTMVPAITHRNVTFDELVRRFQTELLACGLYGRLRRQAASRA